MPALLAIATKRLLLPLAGIVIVVACWEIAVRLIANPGLFPPVERIARALKNWSASGLLLTDVGESVPRALFSLAVAVPCGMAIGIVLALSASVNAMFNGIVQLLRTLPPVALLPLFILWFGIDWGAKVAAGTFVCMFPVIVTTMQGAVQTNLTYGELAHDLNMWKMTYLTKIVIPGAMPTIVPGIRLAAGTSFVMVFVSELAGASAGLGYRISIAQLAYQADLMIAALLVLGGVGLLTDLLIAVTARRMLHYAGR